MQMLAAGIGVDEVFGREGARARYIDTCAMDEVFAAMSSSVASRSVPLVMRCVRDERVILSIGREGRFKTRRDGRRRVER